MSIYASFSTDDNFTDNLHSCILMPRQQQYLADNYWLLLSHYFKLCPEYLMQGPPSTSGLPPTGLWGKHNLLPRDMPIRLHESVHIVTDGTRDYWLVYWISVPTRWWLCKYAVLLGLYSRFPLSLEIIFTLLSIPLASYAIPNRVFDYQSTLGCFSQFTATETIPVTVSVTGTTTLGTVTQSSPGGVNAYTIQVAIQISNSETDSST